MARIHYRPRAEGDLLLWLSNFSQKLKALAARLGVSPGELAGVEADVAWFTYACDAKNQCSKKARDWGAHLQGTARGSKPGSVPEPLTLPPAPPAVAEGVFERINELVARIKHHQNYTEAIGHDLGIIGADRVVDAATLKPVIRVRLEAGQPRIDWVKKGAEATEIHVDRNTGGFVPLAVCNRRQYTDAAPLPPSGSAAVWRYKAIHRLNDVPVGQWSDVVSIGVIG